MFTSGKIRSLLEQDSYSVVSDRAFHPAQITRHNSSEHFVMLKGNLFNGPEYLFYKEDIGLHVKCGSRLIRIFLCAVQCWIAVHQLDQNLFLQLIASNFAVVFFNFCGYCCTDKSGFFLRGVVCFILFIFLFVYLFILFGFFWFFLFGDSFELCIEQLFIAFSSFLS